MREQRLDELLGRLLGGEVGPDTICLRISAGSRPTSAQWRSSTSSLCRYSATSPKKVFQPVACSATIRSVRFSPEPPIHSGIRSCSGFGSFWASVSV